MPQVENKLLIEVVFSPETKLAGWFYRMKTWLHLRSRYLPIQCRPAKYFLIITNIGDNAFDGALIRNITITVAGSTVSRTIDREFTVGTLNHDQSEKIYVKSAQTDLSGQAWVSLSLSARNQNASLTTFQRGLDNDHEQYKVANSWGDTFIIRSRFESNQELANWLIATLTTFIFIDAVWGIKETLVFILSLLREILRFLTFLISAVIK